MNTIECSRLFVYYYVLLLFYVCCVDVMSLGTVEQKQYVVGIGVVQDLKSSFGSMVNLCMDMAISEFYKAHPNYRTRLQLHKKDSRKQADANLAVLEFVQNKEIVAILGPQGSTEETFAAAVGETVQVPIISFTARSSTLSHTENRYFVRAASGYASQAQTLAAICQRFKWPKVFVLYEDTEHGNIFLLDTIKVLHDVNIGLENMTAIPISAEDSHIRNTLDALSKKETKVFLVHLNPELGSRLFSIANNAGMMSEGYAWVITDSISIFLDSIDSDSRSSLDGVLGVRPYVHSSKEMRSFQERFKRSMHLKTSVPTMELNVYGLWAFDAVTALAIAVENVGSLLWNSTHDENGTNYNTASSFGLRLLDELSSTRFRGLSGDFHLVQGKLKSSTLEIFSAYGTGEKRVGFWTPERGISRELSTCNKDLKIITWPGDSVIQPKGWANATDGKLRIGVPFNLGFKEFVDCVIDPKTKHTNATGFSVDIFKAALKVLPFQLDYEFHCYNDSRINSSYDKMLQKIPKDYDMVVGDTTLWAPRALHVEFSLPYSESGSILVVKNKKPFDMWIFVRPLKWDLWLAIFVACILMGVVLRILERKPLNTGEESETPQTKLHGMVYWFPVAILAFQERNMVSNNWSVFVLVCWLFMAFILMQSFTANLSAILTVDQLNFAFSGDYYVGYRTGSYMKDFLKEQLGIKEWKLRHYDTVEDFHNAMLKGGANGGVDVIFEEIPYMKLFLKKYEPKYKMVGSTYRTDGFGFAFPVGSPLVSNFSQAILNVTQSSEKMSNIRLRNFGPGYLSQDPLSSVVSQGSSSLSLFEFAGLFTLIGSFTLFALFCSETKIGRRFTALISRPEQVHSIEDASNDANSPPLSVGEGGSAELVRLDTNDDELDRPDAENHDDEELFRRDADADADGDNEQPTGNEGS